jgi:DNA-binding NarL/FixJ family response regulator
MPITVSIIEDDLHASRGLAQLLESSPDFKCLSRHTSAEEGISALPEIKPNVVLMDINLPGINGVEGVRRLKDLLPETQFMMLTVYEDNDLIFSALKAGATGYLLKRTAPVELLGAIRDVHQGGSPMTSQIARKIVQSFQPPRTAVPDTGRLTTRESEVLDYLAQGYLYKEIADVLHISYATVNTHIRHIYEKLQVRSRTQAVNKHLRKGTGGAEVK